MGHSAQCACTYTYLPKGSTFIYAPVVYMGSTNTISFYMHHYCISSANENPFYMSTLISLAVLTLP